jgi:hypothetical protein
MVRTFCCNNDAIAITVYMVHTITHSIVNISPMHFMYEIKLQEGNEMLREVVRDNVPRYVSAKTKHEKGEIIIEILETIKANSPSGLGLIRQNPDTKRWYYIGTDKAKDKIGHALRKASRDFSHGAPKGSSIIKKKKKTTEGSSTSSQSLLLASPRSAFSTSGSEALQSFKMGPSVPLASITSLSSNVSHSSHSSASATEELQNHPIQVTVPSSPVTRPSSVASNHNNSLPLQQHQPQTHHSYLQRPNGVAFEPHYQHHHHAAGAGGYYGPSFNHYPFHPQQFGKEKHEEYPHPQHHQHHQQPPCSYSSYHPTMPEHHGHYSTMDHQDNPKATVSSSVQPVIDHGTGNNNDQSVPAMQHYHEYYHQRTDNSDDYAILYPATSQYHQHSHQYDTFPPPLASDGSYHRVFDEVETHLQQDEQHHQQSYHQGQEHHQHSHYTSTTTSSYSRIVSTEGALMLQNT